MILLILIALLSYTLPAEADIYQYIDKNDVIHFTDSPKVKNARLIIKETRGYKGRKGSNKDYYVDIVKDMAGRHAIDPSLIISIIDVESGWDERAVSRKGAIGLMQLMPTVISRLAVKDPFKPEDNIDGGVRYFKYLLNLFDGDIPLALAAYNAGPETVKKYGTIPPYRETRKFIKKVLLRYRELIHPPGQTIKKQVHRPPFYKIVRDDGTILITNQPYYWER